MERSNVPQPPQEILDQLTAKERLSYRLSTMINESTLGKRLSSDWLTYVSQPWTRWLMDPITIKVGLEHLPQDRSFILAANHQTFWDLFVIACQIWPHMASGRKPYYFCPTRSEFFYERKRGVAINLLICGQSMYPPIFRDGRRELNRAAMEKCVELLDWNSRTLIGIHPEGRRNKKDPYTLLPAKVGVGRIALRAQAPVIPLFINGMGQTFGSLWKNRIQGAPEQVRMHFGPPVPLDDLYSGSGDSAIELQASQRVMAEIARLGEDERAARATFEATNS